MKKYHLNIFKIVALIALSVFTALMFICMLLAFDDIVWYSDALTEAQNKLSGDAAVPDSIFIEGKQKLQSGISFDKNCYINEAYGYTDDVDWLAAAKALFDSTGLQLYKVILDAPVGYGTTISTNADAKAYCMNFIESLPNVDYSIVIYNFRGGEVGNDWVSIYDTLYFGDSAMNYLSVSDMEMIRNIYEYSYEYFPDYDTRTIRMWETVGNNIANGYDRNTYSREYAASSDWDITYYQDEKKSATVAATVFFGVFIISLVGTLVLGYVYLILYPKRVRAEIEIAEAEADRIILETDVKKLPDVADELADKYLGKRK